MSTLVTLTAALTGSIATTRENPVLAVTPRAAIGERCDALTQLSTGVGPQATRALGRGSELQCFLYRGPS
jgi:hypothetical protein